MIRLATYLCAAFLIAPAPAAIAMQGAVPSRVQDFAICLGRLSAMMANPGILPDLSPDQIRADRQDFTDLLMASLPGATDSDMRHKAMTWRVQARAAQSGLLRIAAYSTDARRVRIAQATLRRQVLACHGMLPR